MKMKSGLYAVVLLFFSGTAVAQDYEYHPLLEDDFNASLGWFRSDNRFKISVDDADIARDDIDFGNRAGVDETNSLLNAQLRWNFGSADKWSLWGQYFKNKASGAATLEDDVEWEDVVFGEGTFVAAGVSFEVIRAFVGYSFVKDSRSDFGAGIGLHNLKIDSYIEGEILVNDEDTRFHRGDASVSAPLPNLGAWYVFAPARNWLLHARVDWISANVSDYDGTLWNTNLGVNYQLFRNFGLDLSYQYFNLDVGIDSSRWKGGANLTYSGPVISLTGNW